ncbi:hypothetical protein WOLCODRAFT_152780 [Wolfiporia cocos MD-104 SS10]|uniref:Uncharacterized protein n=1 Tax=Wolfiporia cocos (strain MD-104) TaxID=742152 RepID=A0A2H3JV08_WOLCO|nr:hypothetical protein WOLCODRAFT_152780 [Wolfiporia cocos MD-104 SS10]
MTVSSQHPISMEGLDWFSGWHKPDEVYHLMIPDLKCSVKEMKELVSGHCGQISYLPCDTATQLTKTFARILGPTLAAAPPHAAARVG